jgi:GNAT superfamily N-acetyltransferase
MPEYQVRPATLNDADALVRHRIGMFTDMGFALDAAHESAYRAWLADAMPAGTYLAWVVEDAHRAIVGGGGITVIPWPPGPQHPGGRVAFVYNVYTEPAHRRQGVARLTMDAIHMWCRREGIASVALNASGDGRPVYEAMGYELAPSPMMILKLQ